MSKYDDVGVVMIPSAVKAEKLYSVLPENGNGDFTHDRNAGTATRVNKEGLIETVSADVPRLDYPLIDGVVQDCPALLLEPARTQLIEHSEEFDDSYWLKTRGTITANQTTSPDGNNTADYLEQSSGQTTTAAAFRAITFTATSYTFSVFAKKKEKTYLILSEANSSGNSSVRYTYFNLDNGSVGTSASQHTAKMENYGDGWYRCSITFTGTAASNNAIIYIADADNTQVVTDSGGLYIWGAQIEAGSYPTSYIPNDGTTATVTRNADVCDSAGTSAEFNDSEGVLYAEIAALTNDSTAREIAISDGTSSDRIELRYGSDSNRLQLVARDGGSVQASISSSNYDILLFNKVAVKYKVNDFALWINGFELGTDTSGTVPSGLDELAFDDGNAGSHFYGRTKEVATFKTALTDSELEQLTSWDSFTEMATGQEYSIR